MDISKSYAGVGRLLQEYINNSDEVAWEKIKAKIDYTYENLDLALALLETETVFSREIKSRIERSSRE